MHNGSDKTKVVIDIGPYTTVMFAETIVITLKILNYIQYSWLLVLSPIILIITSAVFILLFTFLKMLKDNIF